MSDSSQDHRFKTTRLEAFIAVHELESQHLDFVIHFRVSAQERELLLRYAQEEFGKPIISKYVREYFEKHLFKLHPSQKTLFEQKL